MREFALPTMRPRSLPVDELARALLDQHLALWWSCERTLPKFTQTHTPAEQASSEKQLNGLIDGLIFELKHAPQAGEAREAWQQKLRDNAVTFAQQALDLQPGQIAFLESCGIIEAVQVFSRMARRFDPAISADDIYQAARNVMSANFIQLMLGLPVEVTPSIFAYSMLYPYTDNYLDDPAIPRTTKIAFNHRFRDRLMGTAIRPQNEYEAKISTLVGMIEGQFERARYPQVYDSLLAIHAAQAHSMRLVDPGASPFELDVLGISFEKGGTSVLADGYLVAGDLTREQARFLYGYGAFTQLMDDLEDIETDRAEGLMTIFSQTAPRWQLDGLTNRVFHFGRAIFADLSGFDGPSAGPLKELIAQSIDPVLIDTIGRAGRYYSKGYLQSVERHMPFRFAALQKQRARLDKQKVTLGRLVDAFFLNDSAASSTAISNLVESSKIRASAAQG